MSKESSPDIILDEALARRALAIFIEEEKSAAYMRRWARERLPSPIPSALQQRVNSFEAAASEADARDALPDAKILGQ